MKRRGFFKTMLAGALAAVTPWKNRVEPELSPRKLEGQSFEFWYCDETQVTFEKIEDGLKQVYADKLKDIRPKGIGIIREDSFRWRD